MLPSAVRSVQTRTYMLKGGSPLSHLKVTGWHCRITVAFTEIPPLTLMLGSCALTSNAHKPDARANHCKCHGIVPSVGE